MAQAVLDDLELHLIAESEAGDPERNLRCRMSVVTRYAGTAFGFVALLAVMCLCHMVHMGVFHSREMLAGKWKTYRPALVGGLGSIFMLSYIAVVATICAPMRCESHPNGQSTLVDYPQVVVGPAPISSVCSCWEPRSVAFPSGSSPWRASSCGCCRSS